MNEGKKIWVVKVDRGESCLVQESNANVVGRPQQEPDERGVPKDIRSKHIFQNPFLKMKTKKGLFNLVSIFRSESRNCGSDLSSFRSSFALVIPSQYPFKDTL